MPEVSVIIPTYNREAVISRAIESVLKQTFSDFEIIIVDDASTDNTSDVVEAFDDCRIRFRRLKQNQGANAARNEGIQMANGNIISFLDSDDEFRPTYLQRSVDAFNSHTKDCLGVYTSFDVVQHGEFTGTEAAKDRFIKYDEIVADNIVGGFSCVSFRLSAFHKVGELDEALQSSQDYDFFIRVLQEGYRILGIDESLVICHKNKKEDRISDNLDKQLQGTKLIFEKHRNKLTPEGIARLHYYRAFGYATEGDLTSARSFFIKAIQQDPTKWFAYLHIVATIHPVLFASLIKIKSVIRNKMKKQ